MNRSLLLLVGVLASLWGFDVAVATDSVAEGTGAAVSDFDDQERRTWIAAKHANTLFALQRFLETYPRSQYRKEANEKIRALKEERESQVEQAAWEKARAADSTQSLSSFLRDYPQGERADQARARLSYLQSLWFDADVVLFIGPEVLYRLDGKRVGFWRGDVSVALNIGVGPMQMVVPNPIEKDVAVVVFDDTGLPATLEPGNIYVWKGHNRFSFLRSFELPSDAVLDFKDELARKLGVEAAGDLSGEIPF